MHKDMATSAKFITLEGGDGSGKSTLLARIQRHLAERGIRFLSTREPGGTPIAEEIREILLRPSRSGPSTLTPMAELFLYEAARAEHVAHVIRPALEAGTTVLCDRFTHSSLAYQGAARGLGVDLATTLNAAATGGLEPDAVLWLKLDPEQARNRRAARGGEDRLEGEKPDFHEAVYAAFSRIAKQEAARFIVLDAALAPDDVFRQLLEHPLWKRLFGSAK